MHHTLRSPPFEWIQPGRRKNSVHSAFKPCRKSNVGNPTQTSDLRSQISDFRSHLAPLRERWQIPPRQVADSPKTSPGQLSLFFYISPGFLRAPFENSSGKVPHFLHCCSGLVRENPPFVRELFGKRSGKGPFLREFFGGGRTVLQELRKECG